MAGQLNLTKGSSFQTPPSNMLGLAYDLNGNLIRINADGSTTILIPEAINIVPNIVANLGVGLAADIPGTFTEGDIYVTTDTLKVYTAVSGDTWSITDLQVNQIVTDTSGTSWVIYQYDGTELKTLDVLDNSITNAKLAQVAQNVIKGRVTAGTGNVEDLTVSQVRELLAVAYQSMTDAFNFDGQAHSGNHVQTFAASTTFNADNGTNQYMLVSGDCTINISNLNVGIMTIKLKNSGAGHTITIGSSFGDPMDDIGSLKTADGDTNTIMIIRGGDNTYEYTINGRTA